MSVGLAGEHEVEQGAIMNCESYEGGGRRPQPCPVVRAGLLDSRAHLVGETGESGCGQGVQQGLAVGEMPARRTVADSGQPRELAQR